MELYVKENVREAEYDYVYEVCDDAARASNPRRSARKRAGAVSIVSYYDENLEEVPDYVATYNPDQVRGADIEQNRSGANIQGVIESYYVQ